MRSFNHNLLLLWLFAFSLQSGSSVQSDGSSKLGPQEIIAELCSSEESTPKATPKHAASSKQEEGVLNEQMIWISQVFTCL